MNWNPLAPGKQCLSSFLHQAVESHRSYLGWQNNWEEMNNKKTAKKACHMELVAMKACLHAALAVKLLNCARNVINV